MNTLEEKKKQRKSVTEKSVQHWYKFNKYIYYCMYENTSRNNDRYEFENFQEMKLTLLMH